MAGKTVTLNKNASALMGQNTKVRVRVSQGAIQILPTTRKSAAGLPKGEILVDLRSKKQAVPALRFTIPQDVADAAMISPGVRFLTVAEKHNWITLRGATPEELARFQANAAPGQAKQAGGIVGEK